LHFEIRLIVISYSSGHRGYNSEQLAAAIKSSAWPCCSKSQWTASVATHSLALNHGCTGRYFKPIQKLTPIS